MAIPLQYVPQRLNEQGVVVDFYRMKDVLSVDADGMTVTVQPGITWEQLDKQLKPQGLTLRLYPTSYPSSSVGGWLAQGGAGIGSILKSGTRGLTSGGRGLGLRRLLVVAQVALSLILMVGALLFVRSFQKLIGVDAGFQRDRVLVTNVTLPRRNDSVERLNAIHEDLDRRLNALPEVESAIDRALPALIDGRR